MNKVKYYYRFTCGTREFFAYGLDDRTSRRLLDRWIRLCWKFWKASSSLGTMAHAIDNDWYSLPEATISRIRLLPRDIIPREKFTVIEKFDVCDETIAEFTRVWGRRPETLKELDNES